MSCGSYQVLHNFRVASDGMMPMAPLLYLGGSSTILYGTASNGGPAGGGTLFAYPTNSSTDNFTVLESFPAATSLNSVGSNPSGDLAYHFHALWGTTWQGGSLTATTAGAGTIYRLNVDTGNFLTEYTFTDVVDGGAPFAGLTYSTVGGTQYLFGTTYGGGCATGSAGNGAGGTDACGKPTGLPGSGTIFNILYQ